MSRTTRLWIVFGANLAMVGALIGVGLSAHSVGVWAEGIDYFADAAAIGVALLAIRLEAPTPRRAQGHPKATRYAAVVNAGWLFVLSLVIDAGALDRLATGTHRVHGLAVLVVSTVAAAVMVGGALVLGGDIDDDERPGHEADEGGELSVQAVLLDTAADAATAAGVAVTGAVILATGGFYWLDPTMALVISVIVGAHALRLLRRIWSALTA